MSSIVPFSTLLGVFTLDKKWELAVSDEISRLKNISEEVKAQVMRAMGEENLAKLPKWFYSRRVSVFSNTVEIYTIYKTLKE